MGNLLRCVRGLELLDLHKPIPPHASLEVSLESLESWPFKGVDKIGISILKQPESPRGCTQSRAPQLLCCHATLAVLAGTKPCLGFFTSHGLTFTSLLAGVKGAYGSGPQHFTKV